MKKRILVVDDEQDIVDLIKYNLEKEGYDVFCALDGEQALEVADGSLDLVMLDVMMPVLDGLETCRRLKADPRTSGIPIVFLTARSGEIDEVVGLELGADDYVQKPISPRKLAARVKALLRRHEQTDGPTDLPMVVRIGNLEINKSRYTAHIGQREIALAKKEFDLLYFLATHPERVFSREALLNSIWGSDVVVIERTVDVHIRKIREKLGAIGDRIETVKGVGYRYRE